MEFSAAGSKRHTRPRASAKKSTGFVTILDPSSFPSMARPSSTEPRTAPRQPAPGSSLLSRLRRGAARAGANLGDRAQEAFRQGGAAAARSVSSAARTVSSAADSVRVAARSMTVAATAATAAATTSSDLAAAAIALPQATDPAWLLALDAIPDLAIAAARRIHALLFSTSRRRLLTAGIFAAVAAAAGGSSYLASRLAFPMPAAGLLPDEGTAQALLMSLIEPESAQAASDLKPGSLPPLPVMLQTRNYTVRSGDSIAGVAKRFGIRQDTIISLNGLSTSKSFRSGVTLRIPNMDGVTHRVRSGESLLLIARRYGVDMTRLADANNLETASLRSGQNLFIPGAKLSSSSLRNFYGETMVWPLRGLISSPFGYRSNPFSGARTFHSAIDIVVRRGTPVKAAMDGKVADAGYNSVFGKYVIMTHSGGYQTLYAHLDEIQVRNGQRLDQSALIGRSGNTGQSTGPHLHFSLFRNGKAMDPRSMLK